MTEKYKLLSGISSPKELRNLNEAECTALAEEIRSFLVETVTETGGHLASNLGVVELSIALHRVFDTPCDRIVWDVGHQSYIHKILTGRADRFDTLRQPGGLSGFTKRTESEYDIFGAGHSSTSVSAALGIAEAERIKGRKAWTVAVLGDGAFTGGMIHEALNNCGNSDNLRLIIVINENEMSISKNIGAFAKALLRLRTAGTYFRTKKATKSILAHVPIIGKPLTRGLTSLKKHMKDRLYGSNYFEDMGRYYLGPVDGGNLAQLETVLEEAKQYPGATVVHVKTVKGKGYLPAEQNPGAYHSVSPAGKPSRHGFSSAFGDALCEEAEKDGTICAVTAAMESGTALEAFHKLYPERFFDVGIAEDHAVTFAAGLAADGMKPVCAIYSTFLQRAYDSIVHDAVLQRLPIVLCIDRAGLNSGDGATHHGIFDVSFLSSFPETEIFTPATYAAVRASLRAALASGAVAAVRYPSGDENPDVVREFYPDGFEKLTGVRFSRTGNGKEPSPVVCIVCHGRMAAAAIKAADILKEKGITAALALCELIKPYSVPAGLIVNGLPDSVRTLVFIEEEIRAGGFGMNLSDAVSREPGGDAFECISIGTDETFAVPDAGEDVFYAAGVSAGIIADRIDALLHKNKNKSEESK
ncbi:MAG: 1-deoxy-D-xylulose-5-phosphate synthase [Clostridia bacterium]|nr:1-deoxy-D-xylulose-5-phosphate synthase [Clostridia bacterium]